MTLKNNSRFTRQISIAFLITFGIGSLASCRKVVEDATEDEVITYYLNHQRYEEAITLLKPRIGRKSDDSSDRILLASAYAGSVGINIIDCFEALKPKLFDQGGDDKSEQGSLAFSSAHLADESDNKEVEVVTTQESTLQAEKELLKFTQQGSDFLDMAVKLPDIPLEKRFRILYGIKTLQDMSSDSKSYVIGRLYTAILSVVQFLNYFRDALPHAGSHAIEAPFRRIYCGLDLRIFLQNISISSTYLSLAFEGFNDARRRSNNPTYENLQIASETLRRLNGRLAENADLADLTIIAHNSHKHEYCED